LAKTERIRTKFVHEKTKLERKLEKIKVKINSRHSFVKIFVQGVIDDYERKKLEYPNNYSNQQYHDP